MDISRAKKDSGSGDLFYDSDGQDISNNPRTGYFVFNLGNPKITSLQLSSYTIEKIHENYGEPIFFQRLGEPNE